MHPSVTAALFTITQTWTQPRCPQTGEWIKKIWYVDSMEYYSAIRRNAFEPVQMRWTNLEAIIQCEVSQKERQISYINAYMSNLDRWGEPTCRVSSGDTANRLVDTLGAEEGGMIPERSLTHTHDHL